MLFSTAPAILSLPLAEGRGLVSEEEGFDGVETDEGLEVDWDELWVHLLYASTQSWWPSATVVRGRSLASGLERVAPSLVPKPK